MKINQRFIVKLALGFVAIGGGLILAGYAMSGFSWEAYATDHQEWYRTFQVSNHHEMSMGMDMEDDEDWEAEERAEQAEESRELAAERQEEEAEAMSELEESLSELRSEVRELQGVDPKKAAEVEAVIEKLQAVLDE